MIGRLRGVLLWKQPPYLLLDVQGVGYELEASLTTFQKLPDLGGEVTLWTHLAIRDDAHTLYGFANAAERRLFRNLIRVTGIGPRLALLILSGMSVELFNRCVREGDAAALTRLPGIGRKTAERLVIEMRDRLEDESELPIPDRRTEGQTAPLAHPVEDAIGALVTLGYKMSEASRVVRSIDTDGLTSEAILRQALQALMRR